MRLEKFKIYFITLAICADIIMFKSSSFTSSNDNLENRNPEEPIQVTEGLSVMPSAKDKLTQKDIDDFINEYGRDSNIIIYEIGEAQ